MSDVATDPSAVPEEAPLEEVSDPMPDHPVPAEEEAKAAEEEANAEPEKKERRPRGWLEHDVKQITDKFVTGEIVLEGKPAKDGEEAKSETLYLTPHRVARLVKDLDGLEEAPSTGAVAAVFARWEKLGFALFRLKPYAFLDYTDEAKDKGLTAMKEAASDSKKAARKAVRDAEKAAKKAEKEAAKAAKSGASTEPPADSPEADPGTSTPDTEPAAV